MRQSTICAINSTECEDLLQRFTDKVNRHSGFVEPHEIVEPKSIERQISRRMEPVRSFMETLQHIPILGAILFKTT